MGGMFDRGAAATTGPQSARLPATLAALVAAALAAAAFVIAAIVVAATPVVAAAAPLGTDHPVPVILVVGDSISAGYGLEAGQGWVALLAARLQTEGYRERVVNASISGDTTAGGRARLPVLLREYQPTIVVLELGGNDGLRGGDVAATRDNLDAMARDAEVARARVLILGMKMPPNYGPTYARAFDAIYGEVARARNAALVPWLFAGFGEDLSRFQPDHIHPIAAAQPRMLDNVWPALLPLIGKRTNATASRKNR